MAEKADKKPLTDDEKLAVQLQYEADLARYQRQYILLERDRKNLSEATGGKLAKQQKVLKILHREQHEIETDMEVADAPEKRREDVQTMKKLKGLLKEYDKYTADIKVQTNHLSEIEGQIKMVKKKIVDLSALITTDRQLDEKLWVGSKKLETLENKLDVQIKKFCTICTHNREMRYQIGHLLLDRQNFLKIWDKLIKNLTQGKKFMLDLIEQATIAYDQREEWCSKLQALRMKAHNDLIEDIDQMREYDRKKDDSKKFEEFFKIKNQKRLLIHLEIKEREKREERKHKMQEKLEEYQDMMEKIQEFTGEEVVEEIVDNFIKQEAENFTLFKYVNDLNEEMEIINDELGRLHIDIDEERILNEQRTGQQSSSLQALEAKLEEATREADFSESELNRVEEEIATYVKGVDQLIKLVKCDTEPVLRLLGKNNVVTHFNVLLFIAVLEKRIHDLMLHCYHNERVLFEKRKIKNEQRLMPDDKRKPKLYLLDDIVPTNPCPLCVESEHVNDVIDTLQRVLTKDQATEKLRKRLALPDGLARLHNVSACHLPKSRQIIQRRYQ